MSIWSSLAAFRAHCGEPTMPLADCPACSKLPESFGKDDDLWPSVEDFIDDNIKRCRTCRRLYLYFETTGGGNDIYRGNELWWSWQRRDVDAFFNLEDFVGRRVPLGGRKVKIESFFPLHPLLRLGDEREWHVLDSENKTSVLGPAELAKLIEVDPPPVAEWWQASLWVKFVDEIERPDDRRVSSFDFIPWKPLPTPEEQRQIDDARAASRVESDRTDKDGDNFVARYWVVSKRSLICRVVTVRPNASYVREDAVIADNLPLATTQPMFASRDAFRAHCGKPTMPIEQCPICSKIPPVCHREVEGSSASDDRPAEALQLQRFLELGSTLEGYAFVERCPTCHRLYVNETDSLGATLDYSSTWTRYDNVDEIFNLEWTVMMRLPDCEIDSVHPAQFFPTRPLVRIGGAWYALGVENRLFELRGKDAIAKLVLYDPPRLGSDPARAKQYADFVAEIEKLGP